MSHILRANWLKHITKTIKHDRRGQNTVEFAFAVVILLIVTFGIIDFGRAVYTKSVVEAASQEGARMGIVNITDDVLDVAVTEDAVRARMFGLDPGNAAIDVIQDGTEIVQVTVTYNFQFITPMVGTMLNSENGVIELVGTASMLRQ